MTKMIKLTSDRGVARVLDGALGMTFVVESFTDGEAGKVAHVRDYRHAWTHHLGRAFQIWSIPADGYEIVGEMMTREQAKTLKVDDKMRVLCGGRGEVDGEGELTFEAGEIVTVVQINTYRDPQGFAVAISADNGVVNVFDESDFSGLYPFERVRQFDATAQVQE
jgi:hypothetical protein